MTLKKRFDGAHFVAPFAGARIEILTYIKMRTVKTVAPFAGARIEIDVCKGTAADNKVAPFAGARIEISMT